MPTKLKWFLSESRHKPSLKSPTAVNLESFDLLPIVGKLSLQPGFLLVSRIPRVTKGSMPSIFGIPGLKAASQYQQCAYRENAEGYIPLKKQTFTAQ